MPPFASIAARQRLAQFAFAVQARVYVPRVFVVSLSAADSQHQESLRAANIMATAAHKSKSCATGGPPPRGGRSTDGMAIYDGGESSARSRAFAEG